MDLDESMASGRLSSRLTPQDKKEVGSIVAAAVHGNLLYQSQRERDEHGITDRETEIAGLVRDRLQALLPSGDISREITVRIHKNKDGVSLRLDAAGESENRAHKEAEGIAKGLLGAALAFKIPVRGGYDHKEITSLKGPIYFLSFDSVEDLARVINAVTLEESKKIPLPHAARMR